MKRPIFFFLLSLSSITVAKNTPTIGIIFVVDQFGHYQLERLKKYFTGGFKFFLDNGIVYEQAYHPHSMPSTAVGHTALNTGTFARTHGIIGNKWYEHDKKIACDDSTNPTHYVFGQTFGKSPHYLMVDGISDQFIRASKPDKKRTSVGISLKSRSAIMAAGQTGNAYWFDDKNGTFTSSKYYFNQLPGWVNNFNKKQLADIYIKQPWELMYPHNAPEYKFPHVDDYRYTLPSKIGKPSNPNDEHGPYEDFMRTPQANKLLLECAQAFLDDYLESHDKDEHYLLLWISLSSPDKLGHRFGPDSRESIDLLYHIDHQLGQFIEYLKEKIDLEKTVMVLTADHGVGPIPEYEGERRFQFAHRIDYITLTKQLNDLILEKFGIPDLILGCQTPDFYLRESIFNQLDKDTQTKILYELRTFLMKQPGIKRVWTQEEIVKNKYYLPSFESFFKYQVYPQRSGQLVVQTTPYSFFSRFNYGTSHKTPYNYDTHVPLILYQPDKYENKRVYSRVWTTQLANSLAHIFNIQRPSASTFDPLPGVTP